MSISQFPLQVAIASSAQAGYGPLDEVVAAPELPSGQAATNAAALVRSLFHTWGLDRSRFGTAEWNPLAELIPPGSRVVLKPNLVHHRNHSGQGLECLVTSAAIVDAVLAYALLAHPREITIADAPLQSCNFARLTRTTGLSRLVNAAVARGCPVQLADLRRTVSPSGRIGGRQLTGLLPLDRFVLFDLGRASLLESAANPGRFRVTGYDPRELSARHSAGRHQYLIAREILDAGVVINLPKLKCHKKAGMTGALKNMIGINGNKEYLPHHRKGSRQSGGDCYPEHSGPKRLIEELLDRMNGSQSAAGRLALASAAHLGKWSLQIAGSDTNLEGSWHGNDTIWRTCLDLNRIALYGSAAGTLEAAPRRRVIHITDAVVAGEGDGPLAPTPIASRFMTAGVCGPAVDWVNTIMMGFDPKRIPLVAHSFDTFTSPLTDFRPDDIVVLSGTGRLSARQLGAEPRRPFQAPPGWEGHCEARELLHAG
ncbi:MAG TPA: DUF362 domain-containing protein [Bryobacteraceae bacterium]|nr:DUF362 domain-containing protein [Bryobacteraceae bacterium]